jgi:YwiC-like protein
MGPTTGMRALLPKEHGAYGQILFPLATALLAAGVSAAGILVAAAVVAGFLAHEPALVLLGQRGPRAARDLAWPAVVWLACWLALSVAAGLGALAAMDPEARWSLAVPAVPAVLLALAAARGAEKTWQGETCAALAFGGTASVAET